MNCRLADRCKYATPMCKVQNRPILDIGDGRSYRCNRFESELREIYAKEDAAPVYESAEIAETGKEEKAEALKTEASSFVNLKYAELTNKYPFELSGGQMQRLMIARIFLLKPSILLADEPTSMIDACSRATIPDMLLKLRDETGMTVIFITHDIGLAYYISDTVYIMEHGKFVESGDADIFFLNL